MYVSQLVGLLSYWNQTQEGISPVLDDIFLKFVGDISGLLVHQFQIILNFSYVVSLLVDYFLTETRQIQGYIQFWIRSLFEIFWKHSYDVGTLIPNNSEFLVCLSVCQLAYFLTETRQIQGYLQFWMSYLYETLLYIIWMLGHQLRPGQIRIGQVRSGQIRSGQVR